MSAPQIHVYEDGALALIVDEARVVHRVELGDSDEIRLSNALSVRKEYSCHYSSASRDGHRWASLDYGSKKARIQIIDLKSDASDPTTHHFDLAWSPCGKSYLQHTLKGY